MAANGMQRLGSGIRLGSFIVGAVILGLFGITELRHHQPLEGIFSLMVAVLLSLPLFNRKSGDGK